MQVHVSKDLTQLSYKASEWITALIEFKLKHQERFCFLLSGGNTPKNLYELLSENSFSDRIDWLRVHIFFGDERFVPFSDERNNGKMAYDALLNKVPIPETQIHYINTSVTPQVAADDYGKLLHKYFNNSMYTFDLALLGMGDDGHTLSIFPGCESQTSTEKWVAAIDVPNQPVYRISLMPQVVNRSTHIAFIVSGNAKAPILKQVIQETIPEDRFPVQLIRPSNGELHWFVDEDAIGA